MYIIEYCAGVDEAGRGPLAGPVFAAAVVLDPFITIAGLADSKALSSKQRESLTLEIKARALAWSIGIADVDEIDRINILQASMVAMQRAVRGLSCPVDHVVVDGNRVPLFDCPADWLVKGDGKLDAIKAASIIAKVARDAEMKALDQIYPDYGFARHKGYPTPAHLEALQRFGPSPVHRMSFQPCKKKPRTRGSR